MNKSFIHSEILGSTTTPILLFHGWGHSLEHMRPLGEIFSSSYQIHLIDLPGFGKSGLPPSPWGTSEYAEALIHYMDEHNLKQSIILGHSFGGRVAMRLAADYPDRVSGLILINSSGLKRSLSWRRKFRSISISALRHLTRTADRIFKQNWYEHYFIPAFASADFKRAGPLKATFVKLVNEDLSTEAARIKTPTFLLWGEKDTETPVAVGQHFHALIPGSTLKILPQAKHNMHLGTGANLCAFHIQPFLSSLAVDGGSNA